MKSGIPRIDDLLAGTSGVPAIVTGDGDRAAVGQVQDLLRSYGYARLPDARSSSYGIFGDLTRHAVLDYRAAAGLDAKPSADPDLLRNLLNREPPNPVAARAYVTLALDVEWTPLAAVIAMVSLFESGGRFACLNLNTDRAGLSFGLIQWAQKPGRLREILQRFREAAPSELTAAVGEESRVEGLLAHTAMPNGGLDPETGRTTNPDFDLVRDPWKSRFEAMGRHRRLQRVQLEAAQAAFQASLERLRPATPLISTERGSAFLLDLANQHGDGGARFIYRTSARPGMREGEVLAAMENESVRRVGVQFGTGSAEALSTRSRRAFFRTTPWLTDAAGAAVV